MKFRRWYKFDGKLDKSYDDFDNPTDLYIETMELWNCEEFSMELQSWCENANAGCVFEDDDIKVKAIKS